MLRLCFNSPTQIYNNLIEISSSFLPSLFQKELEIRATEIKNKITKDSAYTLKKEEIADLKKAFCQANTLFRGEFKKILSEIPIQQLKTLMEEELAGASNLEDWITSALHIISEENLIELNETSDDQLETAHQTQNKLKTVALKSVLETKTLAILNELSTEMYYFVDHTLNLFIESLGLRDIGPKPSDRYARRYGGGGHAAKSRLEEYLAILLYPSVIFGYLVNALENFPAAFLLTTLISVATILFLICYDRYLSPCPKHCAGLINLNQRVKREDRDPIYAREGILKQIEEAFENGKGALLVGGTGTGKTAIVRALAERIVKKRGSKLVNHAQIFTCNTNGLGKLSQDGVSFSEMIETFERHEREVIPFLDEIHSAFKTNGLNGDVSDDLKTFRDNFPYIIGATTKKEFDQYLKNEEAFLRRFKIIEVKPFEKSEIQTSLYQNLHHKHPELLEESGVIEHICDISKQYLPNTSHIDAAQSLLSSAMFKATHLTFNTLENEINGLNLKKELLTNQLLHQTGLIKNEEYLTICTQLEEKEKELAAKKQQVTQLKKLEKIYLTVWRQGFRLAEQVNQPRKKRQWLENQALVQLLQQAIMKYKKELGLPERLTLDLVNQIANEKKAPLSKKSQEVHSLESSFYNLFWM